jgi:hypothetical protein
LEEDIHGDLNIQSGRVSDGAGVWFFHQHTYRC